MTRTVPIHPDALSPKEQQQGGGGILGAEPAIVKKTATQNKLSVGEKSNWTVPVLPHNFDLGDAEDKAYGLAAQYMNKVLEFDDMQISVGMEEQGKVGTVSDLHTGNVVNQYEGIDILKLYAKNIKERGIIVDGRV